MIILRIVPQKIGLIYGRYLQFGFLEWLLSSWHLQRSPWTPRCSLGQSHRVVLVISTGWCTTSHFPRAKSIHLHQCYSYKNSIYCNKKVRGEKFRFNLIFSMRYSTENKKPDRCWFLMLSKFGSMIFTHRPRHVGRLTAPLGCPT